MALQQVNSGTLNYYLVKNPLIKDTVEYMAKVNATETYDVDRIAEEMIKYNSTATIADVKAVLEVLNFVVIDKLSKGCTVRLPFAYLRPSISGRFSSPAENFDRSRHSVNVRVSPTINLSKIIANVQVCRQKSTLPAPNVEVFTNLANKNETSWSAGFIGQIIGSDLKFDESNTTEGVFMVNQENGDEVKVEHLGKISPNELMFIMPTLPAGSYSMEVRKNYCGGKSLRKGILEATIAVE